MKRTPKEKDARYKKRKTKEIQSQTPIASFGQPIYLLFLIGFFVINTRDQMLSRSELGDEHVGDERQPSQLACKQIWSQHRLA